MHIELLLQTDFILLLTGLFMFALGASCWYMHKKALGTLPWQWLALYALITGLGAWLELTWMLLGLLTPVRLLAGMYLLASLSLTGILFKKWNATHAILMRAILTVISLILLTLPCAWMELGLFVISTVIMVLIFHELLQYARHVLVARQALRILAYEMLLAGAVIAGLHLVGGHAETLLELEVRDVVGSEKGLITHLGMMICTLLLAGSGWSILQQSRQAQSQVMGMDPTPRTNHRRWLATLGIILLLGWGLTHYLGGHRDRQFRQDLAEHTEFMASLLPNSEVQMLSWTEKDQDLPAYHRIKHTLIALKGKNQQVELISLVGWREGGSFILADSETPGTADYSPPGSEYPDLNLEDRQAMLGRAVAVTGPSSDAWGVWISGIAPLQVDPGQAIALMVDAPARKWMRSVLWARLTGEVLTVLGVGIGLGLWWICPYIQGLQNNTNELLYRTVVEGSPNGVMLLARPDRVLKLNASGEEILQSTGEEIANKPLAELFLQGNYSAIQFALAQVWAGQPALVEGPLRINNKRLCKLVIKPVVREEIADITQAVAILMDITEDRKNELLVRQNEAEKMANRSRSDFLARMSHEIRTPINGIIGMTELMRQTPMNPQQAQFLQTINNEAEILHRLINHVLDISKIEAGKMVLENVPFRVRETMNFIVDTFRPQAQRKGLKFTCIIPEDVPQVVRGDPLRLQQVLNNLVSNAVKFTHRGGIILNVCIASCTEKHAELYFSVSDTGIGIPATKQYLVFMPFQQVDTSIARQYGGTGLGSLICQELVQLMNGWIDFQSTEGVGSEFRFQIPFELASEMDLPPQEIPLETRCGQRGRQGKILLVEDYVTNQQIVTAHLTAAGYEVDVAENGRIGVEKWGQGGYGLILMDVEMPELDGIQATMAIRLAEKLATQSGDAASCTIPHIPIFGLTAHATEDYSRRCLEAGMDGCLHKPLRRMELLSVVEQVIETSLVNEPQSDAATLMMATTGTTPAPQHVAVIFDMAHAMGICGDDVAMLEEIVAVFLKDIPARLVQIDHNLVTTQLAAVRREAHTIKGAAGNVGGMEVVRCARILEELAEKGDLESCRPQAEKLRGAFERLRNMLGSRPWQNQLNIKAA